MSPISYDPKHLSESLELDYFQRPRRLTRLIRLACWAALVGSLAVVGCAAWCGNEVIYQAGPVSTAHHMFNQDCGKCHTEIFQPAGRLLPANADLRSVPDATCKQCHDGPDHNHLTAIGCAGCHPEHRGKKFLARVSDGHCSACHADGRERYGEAYHFRNVRSFVTDHPQFALWDEQRPDPGTVKFNHRTHLSLPVEDLLKISTALSAEQRRGLADQLVLLTAQQCSYCHQPDSAGRYMLPIKYPEHCGGCHPLQVQVTGLPQRGLLSKAAREFARQPAPHPAGNEGPVTVRAVLRERYLAFAQRHALVTGGVPAVAAASVVGCLPSVAGEGSTLAAGTALAHQDSWASAAEGPVRSIPGVLRGEPPTESQLGWVNRQMEVAERVLFDGADGCRRCHDEVGPAPPPRVAGLPNYGRPSIPTRWFLHSVFRHDSHRLLDCTACHKGALLSTENKDILLPTIEECRACHNPQVGARTDCAECHTYHQRPAPHPWKGTLTIQDCTGLAPSR